MPIIMLGSSIGKIDNFTIDNWKLGRSLIVASIAQNEAIPSKVHDTVDR